MDLGYINTSTVEVKATVNGEKKTFELGLLSTPDGFETIQKCPLSFGQLSEREVENLGKDNEIQLRKEEHLFIIDTIKKYASDDFYPILERVPYFDCIELLQKLMSGEDVIDEKTVIEDYGKNSPQHKLWCILNDKVDSGITDEEPSKKKVNTGSKKKNK